MRARILILFSILAVHIHAQVDNQRAIDSLVKVIDEAKYAEEKAYNMVLLSDQYQFSNLDTVLTICENALNLVNSTESNENSTYSKSFVKADIYNNIGYYYVQTGNIDLAKENLGRGRYHGEVSGNALGLISIGINSAVVIAEEGDYMGAIEIYDKVAKLAIVNDHTTALGTVYNNTGWIYQKLKEYDKSTEYFRKAAAQYKDDMEGQNKYAGVLNNLGVDHDFHGNRDSARYYYTKSLKLRTENQNYLGMSNSMSNLGVLDLKEGDTLKAIELFTESEQICTEHGLNKSKVSPVYQLAKIMISQKRYAEAEEYMDELEALMDEYPTLQTKIYFSEIKYKIARSKKDWENGYKFYFQYRSLQDSLALKGQKDEVIIHEYRIKSEQEKLILELNHEKEIAVAQEKEKYQQIRFYGIVIILILLLAMGTFYFRLLRQKQRLTRIDLELSKFKNERLAVSVEQKNKELTAYTLRVAQNNQFMENIDEIISNINSSSKEAIEDQLRQLKVEANINKRRDKDWVEFQKQFEGIHTSFIKNLTGNYPSLSTGEVRLCTLIKLNLTSKDIASVLGVSMNTLKSSRYRIHKKIGLEKGQELADFILKFE